MKDKKEEPLKPKTSLPPVEVDDFSTGEDSQERINEKLSISVPPARVPRPNPALAVYVGQRVRLKLKDGSVINGILRGTQWEFLRLDGIEEVEKDCKTTADWELVLADTVAKVYPANAKVKKISKP
ncbi:MAG: hypothetical protein ACLQVJ_07260 [Syntrophobacteraceae bacterium]